MIHPKKLASPRSMLVSTHAPPAFVHGQVCFIQQHGDEKDCFVVSNGFLDKLWINGT
jgi:hypothetical protein